MVREGSENPISAARLPPARLWLHLLEPPVDAAPRWGFAEWLVMAAWCAVVGFAVQQHTPWADEQQAWLLADGVSWGTLFGHSLHYEGTGGLWHALLKLLQAAHLSFTAARWIAAGIEAAAVAMLLRYAPLPPLVRWLLPFTFFLLYQDAVVARSYCLFAVLAFTAAAVLRGARRREHEDKRRSLLLALLLGLLANVSLHGLVASGGLALTALLTRRTPVRRRLPAVALLLVFWVFAMVTMAPARDVDYAAGNNIHRSLAKLEIALGWKQTIPEVLTSLPMSGLRNEPPAVHEHHGELQRRWTKLARALAVITYPLSSSRLLALALAACVAVQAGFGRGADGARPGGSLGLPGLAPYALMLLAFSGLFLAPRHAGTVLTAFVAAAWLTWPAAAGLRGHRLLLARATAALLVLVCVEQLTWSARAVAAEHRAPYAPGAMTAAYLRSKGAGQPGVTLAGYYYGSIDPLLYFPRNLYGNQPPHRYWFWSTTLRNYSTVADVAAQRPALIVIGGFATGPEGEITRDWQPVTPALPGIVLNDSFQVGRYFEHRGYRVTHVFCGHSYMRTSYAELLCDTVLEPGTR